MLGTRDLAELLERVDAARGKLVIAGDTRQLPSIEAGGVLGALATRLEPIELHENRRQQQAWEREAVEAAPRRRRRAPRSRSTSATAGSTSGATTTTSSRPRRRLARHRDPDGCVMIAHYRADVAELNGRARAVMRATGRLGADELVAAGGRIRRRRPRRRQAQRAAAATSATATAASSNASTSAPARSPSASTTALVELDAEFLASRPTAAARRSSTATPSPPTPPRA